MTNGLAAIKRTSRTILDKMRKDRISLFKEESRSITIDTNLIETNLLDVIFNLATGRLFLFSKPYNVTLYKNVKSNHLSTIIKDLPKMINKRLSELSCNKNEFDKAKLLYEKLLKESAYKMSYAQTEMKTVILFGSTRHYILSLSLNSEERTCNCRNKNNCPLAGSCLKTCIVYRADIMKQNEMHIYYDASDGEFKYRYNNQTNLCRNQDYENKTEVSKYIWQLKRNGIEFNLEWSITGYATPYRRGTKICDLCLTEKYIIAIANQSNILNKRIELISKCRHKNKYILKNTPYILN